mmetsp:Transcript_32942/g.42096  ORF Transcript_32942/g.42096 Transcript_32942/m.42096 type:complete len:324 (-) Transcript_32942:377-1348(-)
MLLYWDFFPSLLFLFTIPMIFIAGNICAENQPAFQIINRYYSFTEKNNGGLGSFLCRKERCHYTQMIGSDYKNSQKCYQRSPKASVVNGDDFEAIIRRGFFQDEDNLPPEDIILWSVLRGIRPSEARSIGEILAQNGFTKISVTVDTPGAYESIKSLKVAVGNRVLVGASTVISPNQVYLAADHGASFISSPHTDQSIIKATKANGLLSCPGVMTPTEAFQALASGADALKVFPSQCVPPEALKTIISVLPPDTPTFVSGGVTLQSMGAYRRAGAKGFAIGGSLYQSGMEMDALRNLSHLFALEAQNNENRDTLLGSSKIMAY